MWVYHADNSRAILFGDYSLSGSINFNIELYTSHSVRFYWGGAPDTSGSHTLVTQGGWTHIAIVYNGADIKFYKNGILTDTYVGTLTIKNKNSGDYYLGRDVRTGTTALNGKMNDFRIYDHALSPLEVKHIAQGLILHYPLNRGGWGNDNILINTHFDSRYTQSTGWDTTKNGTQLASSWGGYNGGVSNPSTVYHAHLKEFNGEWVYEYTKTANESWLGISQGELQSKLVAGKTYTFSWEEYHVDGTNRVGTGLYYYKTGATSANFHLGIREAAEVIREIGRWQKYIYTFTAPSDADWSKNMSWYIYGHYNGNGTFYVRHIKLEEGSVATPWCPNSSDTFATIMGLNDNIEYDTSGYGNNGTKIGTFSYNSDTPKYNVSTKFSANTIKNISFNFTSNTWTVAFWYYYDTAPSAYQGFLCLSRNAGGDADKKLAAMPNSSYIWFKFENTQLTVSSLKIKVWTHIVMTFDGTNGRVYEDGVLKGTTSTASSIYTDCDDFVIGARANAANATATACQLVGNMSDVRIYATALSADDVKSLYQNSAYIDNQGNIYGAVYKEV